MSPRLRIPLNIFGSNIFRPLFKFLRVQSIITLYVYHFYRAFFPFHLLSHLQSVLCIVTHKHTYTHTKVHTYTHNISIYYIWKLY